MKTSASCGPWITLDPKPPKVNDRYRYWVERPPALSSRCVYWVRQIMRGWRPNRRLSCLGYDEKAGWFGVYIWELLNVLGPLLAALCKHPSGED